MPELPEVQSVVNYIRPKLLHQTIESIESLNNFEKVFDTHSSTKINQICNRSQKLYQNGMSLLHIKQTLFNDLL